jgi:hypothetical protein
VKVRADKRLKPPQSRCRGVVGPVKEVRTELRPTLAGVPDYKRILVPSRLPFLRPAVAQASSTRRRYRTSSSNSSGLDKVSATSARNRRSKSNRKRRTICLIAPSLLPSRRPISS